MADPQLIVFGPRKRKDAARFADNGDPSPVSRNKKTKPSLDTTKDTTKKDLLRAQHRHPLAQNLRAGDDVNVVRQASPQNTDIDDIIEAEDAVENDDQNPIEVEDDWEDEESADEELGESLIESKSIGFVSPRKNIERLKKQWKTPIYAFFRPSPAIDYIDGRRAHVFECSAKVCKGKGRNGRNVRRYLNTTDATSTSNLRRHATVCWGAETVKAAGSVADVYTARAALAKVKLRDGSITAAFERATKERVTYSNRQHTKTEVR